MKSFLAALALLATTLPAHTETTATAPHVATDIAPVHALAAAVMLGVGEPDLIMPPSADPHHYAMRPSEARALGQADLVFWVGAGLTPWLAGAIETLAEDAKIITLMHNPDTRTWPMRSDAAFGGKEHSGHDHSHSHGHDHGDTDPHAWLDPENGKAWLQAIATALSDADPANASIYMANAALAKQEIDATVTQIEAILQPTKGLKFLAFHDSYQYFEQAFSRPASGAIGSGHAERPGPARIAELRALVAAKSITCILAEQDVGTNLIETVFEGRSKQVVYADPLGRDLTLGASLYPNTLLNLATALATCPQVR